MDWTPTLLSAAGGEKGGKEKKKAFGGKGIAVKNGRGEFCLFKQTMRKQFITIFENKTMKQHGGMKATSF